MNTNKRGRENSDDRQKLLSIVMTGRNDNYMGNFKYRLATCINYLARNCQLLERIDDVEIVVTDWNSEVPLAKDLRLLPEAGKICRFIYVPPSMAVSVVQKPGHVFSNTWAQNIALRRSQGDFLMYINSDTLVPRHSLQTLFNLLDKKLDVPFEINHCLLQCGRKQIPWNIVCREPNLEEWDRYLLLNAAEIHQEIGVSGTGAGTAAQMMHRSLWYECQGNNQKYIYQGWTDQELTLRVAQNYPWLDIANLGVLMFEMNHWNAPEPEPRALKLNPHIVSPTLAVNDENWGLGNHELEIQRAENIGEEIAKEEASKSIPLWNQTREELLTEIAGEQTYKYLQKTLSRAWQLTTTELGILYALSWYSLYYYPRNYLEFGIKNEKTGIVIVTANPNIEIYGIESWQDTNRQDIDRRLIPEPASTWYMINREGYQGYMRFITGEAETAFGRLRDSYIGQLALDMVLLRGELFGLDAIGQLSQLVPHLAPGALVIFTEASQTNFETVWSKMQAQFPQFTYLTCKKLRIGLGLMATLPSSQSDQPLEEEAVLTRAWSRDPKLKKWIVLAKRLKRSWGIIRGRIQ